MATGSGADTAVIAMTLMSLDDTWWLVGVLIVAGSLALFIAALRYSRRRKETPRITIHPKERVVIGAGGPKRCPACGMEFKTGESRTRCARDASHEIHDDPECRELVKGQCPICKGLLL